MNLVERLKEMGVAVDKSKARVGDLARVPRHISEYLLTRFDGDTVKASHFIRMYCPPRSESNVILHRIMSEAWLGSDKVVTILDEVTATPLPKLGLYSVRLSNLDLGTEIYTVSRVVKRHVNLLRHGTWGTMALQYDAEATIANKPSIIMTGFSPIASSNASLEEFMELRGMAQLREWIDLLINTCGLNPEAYSPRQKILYLTRLLPLVEENLYLIELGPRATGKTYIYRNLSRYTRIFSGGGVSPAVLFYNAMTKTVGELAVRDCVVFDEVSKIEFPDPYEMVGKLKDYMESGMYERGVAKQVRSGCSIMMQGNIDSDHDWWDAVLPRSLREPALIDRVHGLIPGWELPKIMRAERHLSRGIGIAADYFSEIMHQLRSLTYSKIIQDHVEITGDPSIRDERAVVKLASAMYKLLRPDGEYDREVLGISVEIALELRDRVRRKLHEMIPGEYPDARLGGRIRG